MTSPNHQTIQVQIRTVIVQIESLVGKNQGIKSKTVKIRKSQYLRKSQTKSRLKESHHHQIRIHRQEVILGILILIVAQAKAHLLKRNKISKIDQKCPRTPRSTYEGKTCNQALIPRTVLKM